jgi:hypothetical protein
VNPQIHSSPGQPLSKRYDVSPVAVQIQ